jgi:hypothetical protein
MDSTDLDKIVDKLLVFRGRMPLKDNLTWYQGECVDEMLQRIDDFIEAIDLFSRCGVV